MMSDREKLEMLFNSVRRMNRLETDANKFMRERVISPLGCYYAIETGPNIYSTNPDAWITVLATEKLDNSGENAGPVGVETYESYEEAKKGQLRWRDIVLRSPPTSYKDAVTGEEISLVI